MILDFKVKALFFDRERVKRATDAGTRKALSKFGAFVRTSARSSIRTRKAISQPGSPPSSHSGLLKKFIFFAYEPVRQSVVIGPVRLNSRSPLFSGGGTMTVPGLLEYGGAVHLRRRGQSVPATYRPRPYMQPAFDKVRSQLPSIWRDSVRRSA